MGGFTNTVLSAGTALLPVAADYMTAQADYEARRDAAAGDASRVTARHAIEQDRYAAARAEAARLRAEAEAEAARRTAFLDWRNTLERTAEDRRAAAEAERLRGEQALTEAHARATAEAEQRRLEYEQAAAAQGRAREIAALRQRQGIEIADLGDRLSIAEQERGLARTRREAEAAEAARLRDQDLRRTQAERRARFAASGLRGSTSARAVLTGLAQETAARDAAAARDLDTAAALDASAAQDAARAMETARSLNAADLQAARDAASHAAATGQARTRMSVQSLWDAVDQSRRENLLALEQSRRRADLRLHDLMTAQTVDRHRLAQDNRLAVYRASTAANRMLTDAWLRVRGSGIATADRLDDLRVRRPDPAGVFEPLVVRTLHHLTTPGPTGEPSGL